MKLTDTDQQLLSLLRENARASTAQIARRLGLSRTTVQSRIERLEREGVISGYTVRVHEEYERGQVRAHIMIAVQPKQMTAVVAALKAMPELRSLHSVSGVYDLIAIGAYQRGSDPRVDAAIGLWPQIETYLRQDMHERVDFADSVTQLRAMIGSD